MQVVEPTCTEAGYVLWKCPSCGYEEKRDLKKALGHELEVVSTCLLYTSTAMLLCSIHEEIPKNRQKKPVALMIPVNLRNYFPSQSMGNFFGWIERCV